METSAPSELAAGTLGTRSLLLAAFFGAPAFDFATEVFGLPVGGEAFDVLPDFATTTAATAAAAVAAAAAGEDGLACALLGPGSSSPDDDEDEDEDEEELDEEELAGGTAGGGIAGTPLKMRFAYSLQPSLRVD